MDAPPKDFKQLKKSELIEDINRLKLEREKVETQMKYLQADFENYRKYSEKQKEEIKKYANRELVKKLIAVMDNFEIALKHGGKDIDPGIGLIYSQIKKIMDEEGVTGINCIGKKFNPMYHEVVAVEETIAHPDGIILEEIQKGYTLKSDVIRTSKVKIAKSKSIGYSESSQ